MARVLRIVIGLVLGAGGALAGAMLWLHWHLHVAPFRGEPFSPERWQGVWACEGVSAAECALHRMDCARGSMVGDLLSRHLAPGLPRGQSQALLGPPEWQDAVRTPDGIEADCDLYMLGSCSGFGVDVDSLYVCFGADGRVVSAGHSQS